VVLPIDDDDELVVIQEESKHKRRRALPVTNSHTKKLRTRHSLPHKPAFRTVRICTSGLKHKKAEKEEEEEERRYSWDRCRVVFRRRRRRRCRRLRGGRRRETMVLHRWLLCSFSLSRRRRQVMSRSCLRLHYH